MNILVIGGSGFIGRPVVAQLTECGHEVIHISRKPPDIGSIASAQWLCCDRFNAKELHAAIHDGAAEAVVDCCACDDQAVETTLGALGKTVRHYVLLSSAAVYGRAGALDEKAVATPSFPLGEAKLRTETALVNLAPTWMTATIIRPSEVFGPRDSSPQRASYFAKHCVNDAPVVIPGWASARIGPVFVDCLVDLIVKATLRPIAPSFVVNAAGNPISFEGLHEAWNAATKRAVPLIDYRLSLEDYRTWKYRNDIPAHFYTFSDCYCLTERAQRIFDWKPKTPLQTAVEKTWQWCKAKLDLAEEHDEFAVNRQIANEVQR